MTSQILQSQSRFLESSPAIQGINQADLHYVMGPQPTSRLGAPHRGFGCCSYTTYTLLFPPSQHSLYHYRYLGLETGPTMASRFFKESSHHRARAWQTSEWVGNSPLSFHPQGNSSYPILKSNVPASNFQLKMISDGPKSFSILLASPLPVLSIVLMGWEPSPNCSSLKVL